MSVTEILYLVFNEISKRMGKVSRQRASGIGGLGPIRIRVRVLYIYYYYFFVINDVFELRDARSLVIPRQKWWWPTSSQSTNAQPTKYSISIVIAITKACKMQPLAVAPCTAWANIARCSPLINQIIMQFRFAWAVYARFGRLPDTRRPTMLLLLFHASYK